MMKLLIVSGSKRKGNSEFVANVLTQYLKDLNKSIIVNTVKLSELNINFCTGCLECDETKRCCIEDDITNIVDTVADSDGIVFISPVRWSLISGEMKTFLDRLNPLAMSMSMAGKKCITIVIGQSEANEGDSVIAASASFKAFADNAEMIVCKQIEIFSCLNADDICNNVSDIDKCKEACDVLIDGICEEH